MEKVCYFEDDMCHIGYDITKIICYRIDVGRTKTILEDARNYCISYEEISNVGSVGIVVGLFTGFIPVAVSIVQANIKIFALRKKYGFHKGTFNYAIADLYIRGYRMVANENDHFVLEKTNEYVPYAVL